MRIYEVYLGRLEFLLNFTAKVKLQWLLNWLNSESPCYIILSITKRELVQLEKKKTNLFIDYFIILLTLEIL